MKATINCDHSRAKIELKQIIYSEICNGEISQGEPRTIECTMDCPDCGLYQRSAKPSALASEIIRKAIKGEK